MRKVAALIAFLLLSLPAFGVYVSSSGFGQGLIYPYYTTQSADGNAFNTYISIVNGHSKPKALRVRIREGRAGREIAAINLFLDAHAMWTAAIVPHTDGGAFLVTADNATCVAPALLFDRVQNLSFLAFMTTPLADGLGGERERVREGYIEVLEMASFPSALPSCENLAAGTTGTLEAPQGYLYGMQTLINVMNGMDFTENAVALAQLAGAPYFRVATDPYPSLAAAEIDKVATFIRNDKLYRIRLPSGLQAVEAAMAAGSFSNEIVLDAGTASATDWVITVPTRPYHDTVAASPWINAHRWADGKFHLFGTLAPRNGVAKTISSTGCLIPCAVLTVEMQAPWAASVLGFFANSANAPAAGAGTTGALGSRNGWLVRLPMDPGGARLELGFQAAGAFGPSGGSVPLSATTTRLTDGLVATENIQLTGMPVIGFMARTFRNGTLDCSAGKCQGNYGGSSTHRVRRVIDPANP